MGITLIFFCFYHLNLVRLNLTTTEKIKKDKLISFMVMIRETMLRLYNSKEYKDADSNIINTFEEDNRIMERTIKLTNEDEKRFEMIIFNGRF
jgi:hypothetical protein